MSLRKMSANQSSFLIIALLVSCLCFLLVATSFSLKSVRAQDAQEQAIQRARQEFDIKIHSQEFYQSTEAANPTAQEMSDYANYLGNTYKIPPIVLKAVMLQESNWRQYNADGTPVISGDGGIGVMQVTFSNPYASSGIKSLGKVTSGSQGSNPFIISTADEQVDINLLKNDWRYNLEIGARILLSKKVASGSAGDDASVLENWWYTLAFYNGFVKNGANDPANPKYSRNVISGNDWRNTSVFPYQECIYNIIAQLYPNIPTDIKSTLGIPIKATLPGPASVGSGNGKYNWVTSSFKGGDTYTFYKDNRASVNGVIYQNQYTVAHLIELTALTTTCAIASDFMLPVIDDNPNDNLKWDVPFNYFGHYYATLGGFHPGEDWNLVGGDASADLGKPVYAVANGEVVKVSNLGTLGSMVVLKHSGSFTIPAGSLSENGQTYSYTQEQVTSIYSVYLHLDSNKLPSNIYTNNCILKGTTIGYITNPGGGPHLHFEIRHPNMSPSGDWSLVLPSSNWAQENGKYTGYFLNLQKMIDSGMRNPRDFISANKKPVDCTAIIGQGSPSSLEKLSFQTAYTSVGGYPILGCTNLSVRTDGYTSFKNTIGHWQNFDNGDIEYHTNGAFAGQAFAVVNPFYTKYASYTFTNSNILGYPISNMSTSSTSKYGTQFKYQAFEGGALENILSGNKAGSIFEVHGAIYVKWGEKGYTNSALGVPWSDESDAQPSGAGTGSKGRLNQFEGGQIYWISNSPKGNSQPAFEVHGAIYDKYVSLGGSAAWLGFPISDEYVSNGYARSDFEGGYITTLDGNTYQAFRYGGNGVQIPLVAGWNLISLPLQPTDTATTSVLTSISGKYQSIWAWNTSAQNWDKYPKSIGLGSLTTLSAGRGYWVYMNVSGTLLVTGNTPSKTVQLSQDWNLVGYNSITEIDTVNALSSISGKYQSIWAWNTTTQNWDKYPKSIGLGSLSKISSGRGYWIYTTQSVPWTLP